ncbi:hypothetical protein N7516_009584 [Penicillium verrucosum]|uniref:uncharacterized protein n=1 Tax=Penicillium verrucosum TaxID=60171 RepID=UPI002545A929|nr:uncharacterized protein N7516_009584 [Penicillium verrucosum]KAJ5921881.1 hypothetical protein N7516_009584 [Penicillium verrucosum]
MNLYVSRLSRSWGTSISSCETLTKVAEKIVRSIEFEEDDDWDVTGLDNAVTDIVRLLLVLEAPRPGKATPLL